MREKIIRTEGSEKECVYDRTHWKMLDDLRKRALEICEIFYEDNIDAWVYGSIARGDVHEDSDIDIILLRTIPSYRIEFLLDSNNYRIIERKIVQATPNDIIKAQYELDDNINLTMILSKYSKLNMEFYKFAGALDYNGLKSSERVPGVDKRLMLIEPTESGHIESPIIHQQIRVAKILKVSAEIIQQRIRVLEKRDRMGRTGIFLNRSLGPDEHLEEVLRHLSKTNVYVRRRINHM